MSQQLPTSDLHLLSVKTILDRTGNVQIKLFGNCMWPITKNEDVVTIEIFPYHKLRVGDVAVFQTTPSTLHANTLFRRIKPNEIIPDNYAGKITSLVRAGKNISLDNRSGLERFWQVLISPANPYGLSLGKTIRRFFQA